MKFKNRSLFYILSYLLIAIKVAFNLNATECGGFFPFSSLDVKKRQEVLDCYDIGTRLDDQITEIPTCESRNFLYAVISGQKTGLVSGVYPIKIDQIKDVNIMCLPQIILD